MNVHTLARANDEGPKSLAEHAYEMLVKRITRLELVPGTLLAEKSLTEQLGIGRTPIREALQRLAGEGLVCHLPHRGMYVCEISAESVQQIFEFRSMFDGQVARLATARATEQHIRVLAELDGDLSSSIEADDIDRFVGADRQFHTTLAEASQNIHIEEVTPRIINQHLRFMFLISQHTGDWQGIARSHEDMTHTVVDAMRRRQPEEAELAVKLYVIRQHQEVRDAL